MSHSTDIAVRGEVIDGTDARLLDRIHILEMENEDLRLKLREAERQVRLAKSIADAATRRLRQVLSPLYQALQQVFGELDVINPDGPDATSTATPANARAYEPWKQKLGKTCAKVIDALLEHGPLDNKALVLATGYDRTTLPRPIAKLRQAGLLLTRDGKYELRQL